MNWGTVAALLLRMVVWLIQNKLDDLQKRQLGYDQAFQQMKEFIDERVLIANKINEDSAGWSDDDVDNSLRPYFRSGPASDEKEGSSE